MDQQPALIPFRVSRNRRIAAGTSVGIVLACLLCYLGLFRWIFGTPMMRAAGGVVSITFVCGVPFAFGALCVAVGRWRGSDHWVKYGVIVPVVVMCLGLILSFLFQVEAAMCVLMGAPLLLGSAILGGGLAHLLLPRIYNDRRLYLSFAVLLPFAAAAMEGSLHWPAEFKRIETDIVIQAPAEAIWAEIASVRAIDPRQIPSRWIYWIGFPKPIAATLDRPGVGGVRTATFERGVSFCETVTTWDPARRLAFTIHADPKFIPRTAFDQHIIVGGRFYDVLDGIYEIEPLGPRSCRLHLTSHHRLGTRFNAYAGWWSERVMDQIQGSILEVIKTRAEENTARQSNVAGPHPKDEFSSPTLLGKRG